MPSTYTGSNGFEKIGSGEQNNTWGAALNNDMDLLDQAIDGVVPIALSNNTYELTIADGQISNGRAKVIIFQGSPASTVTITIAPSNIQKVYWIVNQTGQTLLITNGAGVALSVASTSTAPAFCDGSGNVVGLQAGNNNFSNLSVGGNATITGSLGVGGDTTLGNLIVSGLLTYQGKSLTDFVNGLIPSLTSLPGSLVVSDVTFQGVSGGGWNIFTFATVAGTRCRIAIGSGIISDGQPIPVPSGFTTSQMIASCSLGQLSTADHGLNNINVSMSGANVNAKASDNEGNNFVVTANWFAMAWLINQ